MNEKIRILHCLQTIGSGGVERRRLSLAKLLNQEYFELKIVCTAVDGNFYKEFEKYGVEVFPVGVLSNPFQLAIHKNVRKIIRDFQPHIIHGAVFEGVTIAAINGFFNKVPIIILEETSDPITRSWKANFLMHLFGLIADRAVGVSPASVQYLKEKAKIPKEKVCLINNGVSLPRTVSRQEVINIKKKLSLEPDEIVIGSVGRMMSDEHKRFSDLIKAFKKIQLQGLKTKLILVGDGPAFDNYRKLSTSLKISDSVLFIGYSDDVSLYYNIFDIFALVSAHEAFGLVLAEAMLHKLPIVATGVGGMKYIVKDKKTGFLVERFDIDAIADKLKILIQDGSLRKEYGEAGYRRALQNYTEEMYVKNVEKLYLNLIQKKKLI
ncbi:MAG: group 1 glycosyl transferase [Flavobacteriaceae bacterium]|nr:group 1 glycosyl transferase [Flavobacteriaceae bacterium]